MHRLLKRQIKKSGIVLGKPLSKEALEKLLDLVGKSYYDSDDDRNLLEHSLDVSSVEMQDLYRQQQQNAWNSEAKYSRLITNLKDHYIFYSYNTDKECIYISDSLETILGYNPDTFNSHYLNNLTDDIMNRHTAENVEAVLRGEQVAPYVVSLYHKDGSSRVLEITEKAVFDDEGMVVEVDGIARDITKLVEIQEKLNYLAKHDALTGILNRNSLYTHLTYMMSLSKRENKQFAMLFLDLDHFKNINDTLGHEIGDFLLKEVVHRVQPNIRQEDLFARVGGDEFVIVYAMEHRKFLAIMIEKVMELLRQTFHIQGHVLNISASVGVALYPDDGVDITGLMKNADIAMYKAKEQGRDQFHFYTEALNEDVQQKVQLEKEMHTALASGEFVLYYQPKVRTVDNAIIGAEALIRWNHPQKGLIYPDEFIPLSENTGFILKLGEWIIEEGCRTISEFNAQGFEHLQLSINLSTRQLQNVNLYKIFVNIFKRYDVKPGQLALEMTESVMITKTDATIGLLHRLKNLGMKLCMDDFGTGYSALSYLHQYPIDVVKIDKSFIDIITSRESKAVLLDTIIAMGETLDLKMVAEGVEHEYQREYLIEKGCEFYQGYLFSKPMEKERYFKLLQKERRL